MSVGGVDTAAVYLSPQAITPLSASKEPFALALAARPDLAESTGPTAAKATEKVTAVDKVQETRRTSVLSDQATTGAAFAGRVDVYA
jgi:hypothetical protein